MPGTARDFLPLRNVQIGSGAHLVSYSISTEVLSRDQAARTDGNYKKYSCDNLCPIAMIAVASASFVSVQDEMDVGFHEPLKKGSRVENSCS
jgi:hypothetical protein